jgi:chromosome segregation ATPase
LGVAKHEAPSGDVAKLLEEAADEERRLLKLERKAEKRVASLRADLEKSRERFEAVRIRHDELQAQVKRRTQALAEAEAELARHHAARATGPDLASTAPTSPTGTVGQGPVASTSSA